MVVGSADFCFMLAAEARLGAGLKIRAVATTAAARSILRPGVADTILVVVDADLPDGEAFSFCADLTGGRGSLPVMMVGTTDSEAAAVRSLEAGAIDYFPRPQKHAELLARLRAHVRSLSTSLEVQINIGPFTFRPGQRTLVDRATGARIWLTAKETRLLRRLDAAYGEPVKLASLLEAAWHSANTSSHTLHTHIYRLRSKLGAGTGGTPMLRTVREGYVLVH